MNYLNQILEIGRRIQVLEDEILSLMELDGSDQAVINYFDELLSCWIEFNEISYLIYPTEYSEEDRVWVEEFMKKLYSVE